jgi:uncharacterized membrane protein (UPF0127 family)
LNTKTKLIVNLTRGGALCVGEMADRPLPRMRGLIGRRGLPAGEGLLLHPAPAIHTAFVRFPIDALFLDRELRVLDIVERLRPWRIASRPRARAVLELAAGESARRGVEVGDRLSLRDRRPVVEAAASPPRDSVPESSESIIWSTSLAPPTPAPGDDGVADAAMRVLVVSEDRHFRSVTTMLLAHRGCSVTTTANMNGVVELTAHGSVDVVVVDAGSSPAAAQQTAMAIRNLTRPVGVVVVGDRTFGASLEGPVVEKWGPFEELFAAIQRASADHGSWMGNGAPA